MKIHLSYFGLGLGWEEKGVHESCIWLEFDAKTYPPAYWEKIDNLVGISGKYYSEVELKFTQVYMNAWIQFFLKKEYLEQFYEVITGFHTQKEILTGFINEVLNII